jgi:hypothetical protein
MKQVKNQIVAIAEEEWKYFGRQRFDSRNRIYKRGKQETDEGYWQRIGHYWRSLGFDIDGKDTHWAWSAAFVSYVMRVSGLGMDFKYSIRHSDYIKAVAEGDLKNWEYKDIRITPIEVGDILCYARQPGIAYGKPLPKYFKSHGDIVVKIDYDMKRAYVIGGNVSNSVTKVPIDITHKNMIPADKNFRRYFCVLKNNLG